MNCGKVDAMTNEQLDAEAKRLTGRGATEQTGTLLGKPVYIHWSPSTDISAAGELWVNLHEIRIDGPLVFVWMKDGSHANAPIEDGNISEAIAKATTRAFIIAAEENHE